MVQDLNPCGGVRFSTAVQVGPGANAASYTMGTRSFPGVKQPGYGVNHPPSSSAKVKETVEFTSTSPPPQFHVLVVGLTVTLLLIFIV